MRAELLRQGGLAEEVSLGDHRVQDRLGGGGAVVPDPTPEGGGARHPGSSASARKHRSP